MNDTGLFLILSVIVFTIAFDFINGFNDTANAIATVISTRSLKPKHAIIMAACFELLGALFFTEVAKTVGKGIVHTEYINTFVLLSAILGAIIWNLITWYFGIPSSSSHALFGGLIGATIVKTLGLGAVIWSNFFLKIILPLFLAPVIGLLSGGLFMITLLWLLKPFKPPIVNKIFLKLQIISSALVAFSHGANDAQKSMGIITLALLSGGYINSFEVPLWVKLSCAIAIALGTATGGWRIIKTMGSKICKLRPVSGFAAQTSTAAVIISATIFGAPISTTHIVSSSIMGVGASRRISSVRWKVAIDMFTAWIITIPVCAALSGFIYYFISLILK